MSFPIDATLKDVVRDRPADYETEFNLPRQGPVTPLNIDLSTLSAATDVALGYGEPLREIFDLNFQSGCDPFVDRRVHLYNAVFGHRYHVDVRSVLILLRPAADHPNLTGKLSYGKGDTSVKFRYKIIRMWQRPVKRFLRGGLGLLLLAPLCAMPDDVPLEGALKTVIAEIDRRLHAEASHAEAAKLMTGAYILTGLRVRPESLADIFRGVKVMQDSSAYQLIMDEGQIRHAHRSLLRQGRHRFGPPTAANEAALLAITDIDRLDRMTDAILTVACWDELLLTP